MPEELGFKGEAAAEYDRGFAHVTMHFIPFLLWAAHVAPGMRVLDIATGTGLSAEAGSRRHWRERPRHWHRPLARMVEKARERLARRHILVSVEDAQTLSFPDQSFDAVLCDLGPMFFRDAVRGLSKFRRVLRHGGRAAVSVNTVPERSYNHQIT